jgi:hypothetical protein
MIMKLTNVLIFSLALMNFLWAQSPWLQKKGSLLTQVSVNSIQNYSELYLSSGETFTTERNLTDNTVQAWIEYGLFENTLLKLVVPAKFLKAGDLSQSENQAPLTTSGSLNAFGNVTFSWKQKWAHQTWLFTSHLNIELPTAQYDDKSGLRSGYDAWAFSAVLSAGRGFGPTYVYAHLGIGDRTNEYSNFYTGGFEWGYHILKSVWIAGVLNVFQSFENGDRIDPDNNILTGLYLNDQKFVAWGIKVFGQITDENFGYSAALFGAFNGNFVAKSPSINLGLYYRFSITEK